MILHSKLHRLAAALLLALVLSVFVQPTGVQAQSNPDTDPFDFHLPFIWQGTDQIEAAAVAQTMPPFEVVAANGDFLFSRVDEDSHVRILPAPGTTLDEPRSLTLAWRVTDDEVGTMAGNVVEVSLMARAYSPPEGVRLYVAEGEGQDETQSNTVIDGVNWQTYSVARSIPDDADAAEIGFDWILPAGNTWMEFRDMVVTVQESETFAGTLAPTVVAPTLVPTATPFVVTSTPVAPDVFAAATMVASATEEARHVGTATPTPENMVTATFTPPPTETPTPIIVQATSTPGNQATAAAMALHATAVAFTTGTPTAFPQGAKIVTPVPPAAAQGKPTATPTPLYVLLSEIAPTRTPSPTPEFPAELVGKILFKATFLGNERKPDYLVMNPDGSGLGRLANGYWYNRAVKRDRDSGNRQYHAFVAKEHDGFHRLQIFYDVIEYGSTHQLTFFGAGKAWDPVWSPTDDVVALVSNESRNDEIWIVRRDEWPAIQLTDNDWEWDKHPSFSPDGSQIIFSSNRGDGRQQLWIMDADGGDPRQLTNLPFEAWDPVWVKYPDS